MHTIIHAALDRSRTVLATLVLVLVAGVFAYIAIPKESDPDVDIPIIIVTLTHEGISPEDAERLLVRPVEVKLRAIEGVKEMRSFAAEGSGTVQLEFTAGFDADKALRDVRVKVDEAKRDLPADTEEPTVRTVNVSLFPVLVVTLSGGVPERSLVHIARGLRDRIEELPGVLEAEIVGLREELLEIVVDPVRLEHYRVDQAELLRIVTVNNRLVAAGALDTGHGRFSVKVPGLLQSAKDVLDLPIRATGDGVVRVRDLAEVRSTFKDAVSYARLNGQPAIAIEVKKRIGENVILTIDSVKAAVNAERARLPANLTVTFTQDRSQNIKDMLSDLQNNLLTAVVMVMIVVVAALGWRSAVLVGVAIPASFLAGILVLGAFGLTINIVVLFSLILAAGNVVDGAIVVTEYAERRMTEGRPRREAYAEAATRMAWPITASIATQACAFLPLLFWPGVVGEFMKFLPITQVATLVASLVVALIFVTVLGAYFGHPAADDAKTRAELAAAERGDVASMRGFAGWYARHLANLVQIPGKVTLATVAVLIVVQVWYATHGNGVEFFPDVEPDQALVYVRARGNLSIDEKDALVREVETRVLAQRGIEAVYTRVGAPAKANDLAEDVIGTVGIEFEDWKKRQKASVILARIRAATAELAGVMVEARKPPSGPPTGKPIQVRLSSHDAASLPAAAAKVRAKLETMPGLLDFDDSRPLPGIEWQIRVDRAQAARFGADVAQVGSLIQLVTTGVKVGGYRPDQVDEEVDIRVRFPRGERGIDQLDSLRVATPQGLVPIANFVERKARPKLGTIERVDGKRTMVVRANVADGILVDDKIGEIKAWLAGAELPAGVDVKFKGQDEEQAAAAAFLGKAFAAALFLMAIVLITQFNSFYRAFLILSSVVLSTIGVFIGLIVTGQPFGIVMTGIGVIALAGIVVNNNIVLIDTYAALRRQGIAAMDAAVRTGAQRLRPVFLTAFVSVLGLLPMVFSVNVDFFAREIAVGAPAMQWWTQLATAITFGLSFATVLTLVVTPCLLVLGENFGLAFAQLRPRRRLADRRAVERRAPEAGE
jgi:multidrug efflux pump